MQVWLLKTIHLSWSKSRSISGAWSRWKKKKNLTVREERQPSLNVPAAIGDNGFQPGPELWAAGLHKRLVEVGSGLHNGGLDIRAIKSKSLPTPKFVKVPQLRLYIRDYLVGYDTLCRVYVHVFLTFVHVRVDILRVRSRCCTTGTLQSSLLLAESLRFPGHPYYAEHCANGDKRPVGLGGSVKA